MKWVLPVVLLFGSIHLQAQTARITGRVISADDGTGLPGVSILEKGTTNGTVSDAEGNYSISLPSNSVLVFSFVGFSTQEIEVNGRTSINVTMESDVLALSEIVVIGYGQQERKDVTGVISAVSSDQFNKGAIVAPEQLITGKIAGVQVLPSSGEPGAGASIRVRGGTSINSSNEPLIVIDGVPIDNAGFPGGRNPLNFVNSNDIESFTVLKDASAAGIYGSRAANGVILITTKKGKAGTPKVTYDGFYSVGRVAKKLDVLNAQQFRDVMTAKAPQRLGLLAEGYDTDWQEEIFQTATGQSHAITVSGGTDKTTYRSSFGFLEQNGIIRTSSTERINFSLGLSQKAIDDKLTIDLNFKGAQTQDSYNGGGIGGAISFAPTQPIRDANSKWGGYWEWNNDLGTKNPVAENELTKHDGKAFRGIGNLQLDYKIIEGLSGKVNLAADIVNSRRRLFRPTYLRSQYSSNGEIQYEYLTRVNPLLDIYFNYVKELNDDHKIDVTAGYSYQGFNAERTGNNGRDLSSNSYSYYNPAVAGENSPYADPQESRLISFFGRVNYSLKDKYLFTFNARRDGSSRFSYKEWGFFPSAAFAWRAIDEDFMSNLRTTFSDLKLRVGYGVVGNQEFGNYRAISTFRPSDPFSEYQFGDEFVPTLRPNGYKPLKWEETASINVGVDFGLLDGRLTGTLDVYQKNTTDLLFEVAVPAGANLTNRVIDNIGEIRNRGIELGLDGIVIDKSDLRWNLGFNISTNKNEIRALDGDDDPSFKGYEYGGIAGGVGSSIQILRVGQSINTFRVYRHLMDDNGKPRVDYIDYNENGTAGELADMYADLNGDGVVNDEDRLPYKNANPKVQMGLTSNLSYKGFDFSFTLRANLGNYVYNNVASSQAYYNRVITELVPQNMPTSVLETNFNAQQLFSDYYVENASFLRMDNITLGYRLPNLPSSMNARLYVTAQNPFVLTKYSGVDPEIGFTTGVGVPAAGIDNNLYPRSRTFVVGVSLGF